MIRKTAGVILFLLILAGGIGHARQLHCDGCNRLILGTYILTDSATYCSEHCYRKSLPRCDRCGEPMVSWLGVDQRRYCPECSQKPRCSVCGLLEPGLHFPDHRFICDECHRSAVINPDQARLLFEDVRRRLRSSLGLGTDHAIVFELVSRSELAQRGGGDGQRELGLYRYEADREEHYQVQHDRRGQEVSRRFTGETLHQRRFIDVLYGLPRTRFAGVVGHELAHDFEREHFPGLPELLSEGWAEYVASLVHRLYGAPEWNRRLQQNKDPVYGDGFRAVRRIAHREDGLNGLIRYLKSQADKRTP